MNPPRIEWRRRAALEREVFELVERQAVSEARAATGRVDELVAELVARRLDPLAAAKELLALNASGSRPGTDPRPSRPAAPA